MSLTWQRTACHNNSWNWSEILREWGLTVTTSVPTWKSAERLVCLFRHLLQARQTASASCSCDRLAKFSSVLIKAPVREDSSSLTAETTPHAVTLFPPPALHLLLSLETRPVVSLVLFCAPVYTPACSPQWASSLRGYSCTCRFFKSCSLVDLRGLAGCSFFYKVVQGTIRPTMLSPSNGAEP